MEMPNKYYHNDIGCLVKKLTRQKFAILRIKSNESISIIREGQDCDIVILPKNVAYIKDLQKIFTSLQSKMNSKSRLIVIYYNHLWELLIKLANLLGWRHTQGEQNWLDEDDIKNLLELSGFEVITSQKRMLFPLDIPIFSDIVNKYFAFLPLINSFCLTTYSVSRKKIDLEKDYSISIIVAARNEEGNISKIVNSIPKFGTKQEIIFVEGNSKDGTWAKIVNVTEKKQTKNLIIKAFKQKGVGKADAVRLGFSKATGEILMIYDADRTVEAKDLSKFYKALKENRGEFINGSRLVYPMEKDAMRTLNKIGNKVFSILFTWILGQRFKDTLCGTKAFFKKDYLKFKRFKDDPFGDFELIFGAIENNLKVLEIPVRYKERVYGSTNISRFKHGMQLFKITWLAFRKFKAW